jgi:hypothetical protein
MWEEDPRWQEANYRFSIVIVIVGTIGVAIWSAWEQDWSLLGYWAMILGIILCALLFYGSVVWLVYLAISCIRVFIRKALRRKGPDV